MLPALFRGLARVVLLTQTALPLVPQCKPAPTCQDVTPPCSSPPCPSCAQQVHADIGAYLLSDFCDYSHSMFDGIVPVARCCTSKADPPITPFSRKQRKPRLYMHADHPGNQPDVSACANADGMGPVLQGLDADGHRLRLAGLLRCHLRPLSLLVNPRGGAADRVPPCDVISSKT